MKLQIWNMTQYDRLVWMDSDAILSRNVDYLFDQKPGETLAQQDNWDCGSVVSGIARFSYPLTKAVDWLQRKLWDSSSISQEQSKGVCSGMLVLQPSTETFADVKQALEKKLCQDGSGTAKSTTGNATAELAQKITQRPP